MPNLIYDKEILPKKKILRVSIRAWSAKNDTVNYQFRITGNVIKDRSTVWRNTDKLSGKKLETQLEKFAYNFQRQYEDDEEHAKCGLACSVSRDILFSDYYTHFIDVKRSRNTKNSTLKGYDNISRRCLERFSKVKISDITVSALNAFYTDLKSMPKENGKKARCRVDLKAIMNPFYITQTEIYTLAGISEKTVATCISGHTIEHSKARKIYDAFIALLNDKEKLKKTNGIRSRKRKPEPPITKIPKYKFTDIFETISNNETLSDKTIWEHHQFLCTLLNLATKEGIIKYNPALYAEKPKYTTPEQDVFSIDDIKHILTIVNEEYQNGRVSAKWRAIMYLLIYTGGRRGEIAGLRWDSIDFEKRELDINNNLLYVYGAGTYSSTPKTKSSVRKLAIADDLLQVLLDYKKEYEENKPSIIGWNSEGYVFTQTNGKPINPCSITDWCRNFSSKYNLPHIHPHAFRHSAATNLIHQNADVVTVSHLLGHSKPSVTMDIYAHAFRDNNSAACNAIADIYGKKTE